jgi:NADH-quinone oxidoreductase subunit H
VCSQALSVSNCILQVYSITLFRGGAEHWWALLPEVFGVVFISVAITSVCLGYKTDDMIRWMWKWPAASGLPGLALVTLGAER